MNTDDSKKFDPSIELFAMFNKLDFVKKEQLHVYKKFFAEIADKFPEHKLKIARYILKCCEQREKETFPTIPALKSYLDNAIKAIIQSKPIHTRKYHCNICNGKGWVRYYREYERRMGKLKHAISFFEYQANKRKFKEEKRIFNEFIGACSCEAGEHYYSKFSHCCQKIDKVFRDITPEMFKHPRTKKLDDFHRLDSCNKLKACHRIMRNAYA